MFVFFSLVFFYHVNNQFTDLMESEFICDFSSFTRIIRPFPRFREYYICTIGEVGTCLSYRQVDVKK